VKRYKKYGEQFLALINTLRTNDFQEPEYKKVAQVELEYVQLFVYRQITLNTFNRTY
jgi:hypothetical protein